MIKTFIVRESRSTLRPTFKAVVKPWGLYVMKLGRNLHEIGHFETREQAISLASILADDHGDIRVERVLQG